MLTSSENILLQRFITRGDTKAFSEIVRAHAGLVYGVCLRILGDKDKAADATQETFYQLLQKARHIETSIPAWLHRVASRKAVDMIRNDSARRRTEAAYAERKDRRVEKWEDIAPYVDKALNALDEEIRDLLIQYYFENRSMTDIATEKGVSHPTVSRRIEAGLTQLRQEFRRKGIVVAAVALSSLLTENAAQAVPAAVVSELAKITLLGTKILAGSASSTLTGPATSATRITVSALAATAKTKLIVAIAVGAVVITGTVVYKHSTSEPAQNVSQPSSPSIAVISPSSPTTPASSEKPLSEELLQPVNQEPAIGQDVQAQLVPNEQTSTVETLPSVQPTLANDEAVDEQPTNKLDLSTPEAAVQTYIRMFATGDYEGVMACMNPDSSMYDVVYKSVTAGPGDSDYGLKLMCQSLDPDAEMNPTNLGQKDGGTRVSWTITFKYDVTVESMHFPAGSQREIDAILVQRDGKWLVDNF